MHEVQTVLWLLVAVVVLVTFAKRIAIPYPIVLVFGGALIGAIDFLPDVELEPDIVFLLFLPPALFMAAAATDWRGFRRDLRPITALAVNLVLTTTVGVAVVAVAVISGLDWSTAFVIGAIVSPPDAVATVSIVRALPVPRRVVTILEGESLINDATALVTYRFAVAAVVSGSFSIVDAGLEFIWVVIGGLVIGTLVAVASTMFIKKFIDDSSISMMATILIPVAAYLPAEELHASGVLATVAAGLQFSRFAMLRFSAAERLQFGTLSRFVSFLIDGLVFILIGLQLPTVINGLEDRSWETLAWYGVAVAGATVIIRVLWVRLAFGDRQEKPYRGAYVQHRRTRRMSLGLNKPERIVIGWAGPRGVVTLATALALPYQTDAGTPFPERNLIIFLAFCVILATLVGQGLTLPPLIRRLKFADDHTEAEEHRLVRLETARAALAKIDEFTEDASIPEDVADTLRAPYRRSLDRVEAPIEERELEADQPAVQIRQLFVEILAVQRETVRSLNIEGEISDSVRRDFERMLDLQESARAR
jgi:CPA1 family monovalent cation:H+ antiporter